MFKLGGDRLDHILIKTAKYIDPKKVFKGVSEFSSVGYYSLVKGHNVNDNNYSLVCSPSDHFGVYAGLIVEIWFNYIFILFNENKYCNFNSNI